MARSVDDVALFSAVLSGRPELNRPGAATAAPTIGLCLTLRRGIAFGRNALSDRGRGTAGRGAAPPSGRSSCPQDSNG